MERLLYSVNEACERLGLSRTTVYELIRSRQLASFTVGSRRLIPAAELERLISEGLERSRP